MVGSLVRSRVVRYIFSSIQPQHMTTCLCSCDWLYELVCILLLLTKESHACGCQGRFCKTKVHCWHNHTWHVLYWLWLATLGSGITCPDGWLGAWGLSPKKCINQCCSPWWIQWWCRKESKLSDKGRRNHVMMSQVSHVTWQQVRETNINITCGAACTRAFNAPGFPITAI
jgi:hypothetical protein